MNTIKISYFNNNKTINTTINLNLFPGKTLPAANSPNFKSFICLQKQNDIYKKWGIFSGIENWQKSKKDDSPFEKNKSAMPTFIDDAVYKKFAENGNNEKNNEKNNEPQDDTTRQRTRPQPQDDTTRQRTRPQPQENTRRQRRQTKGGTRKYRKQTKGDTRKYRKQTKKGTRRHRRHRPRRN
jgi:hypothetical protein